MPIPNPSTRTSPPLSTSKFLATLFIGTAAITSLNSFGAVVLTINVQDPSHVTFTAVANNSANAANVNMDYNGGITLLGFFTTDESISGLAIAGNWSGRNAGVSYNETVTFVYPNSAAVPGKDLSIYYNVLNPALQAQFVTSAPPFSGSGSANMATYSAGLPTAGTSGNVYYSFNGALLGQWNAVPEPAETMGAIGAGLIAFAWIRRTRATRQ